MARMTRFHAVIEPASRSPQCFRFADLELDPGRKVVRRGQEDIELPKLSYELLGALVQAAPDTLSADELMDRVWDGAVVSPATVAKRVELLRQALGDDSADPKYVALVRGHGYRLLPPVVEATRTPEQRSTRRLGLAVFGVAMAAAFAAWLFFDTSPAPERSVAVIPFVSFSEDPEDEVFADGLTEELSHALARVNELRVTGRTSSFYFKGKNADLREIGKALGVANVVEGSVRRSGERLRVTAQLVDAESGFHLWSEVYDRQMADIIDIQEDIARNVVRELQVTLLDADEPLLAAGASVDPTAYALYLRAVSLSAYGMLPTLAEAQELIEQVVEIDPDFAKGWNRLAAIHGRRLFVRDPGYPHSPAEGMAIIRNAVSRARELDPDSAEVYANLGGIAWVFEGDAAKAAPLIERALELDPSDVNLLQFAIDFTTYLGRIEEARDLTARLVDRDPLCMMCRVLLTKSLMFSAQWAEAEEQLRTLQVMEGSGFHWNLGIVLLFQERPDEALASFEQHEGFEYLRVQGRALALHDLGRAAESAAALESLRQTWGEDRPLELAQAYAYLGMNDEAFAVLDSMLPEYLPTLQTEFTEPLFHPLYDDPRWEDFLVRIGRSAEQIAAIPFTLPTSIERYAETVPD